MKGRLLVLDADGGGRTRAALLVDGRLEDLLIDPPGEAPGVGDVFVAMVDRPGPGGGAFVRLSARDAGFLRDARGVGPGAPLIVQATSQPEAGKAIPVTRRVLIKTRTVILTPGAPGINVSRRIADREERERLTGALGGDDVLPGGAGCILRSVAEGAGAEAIRADLADALTLWDRAQGGDAQPGPRLRASALATALIEWTDRPGLRIAASPAAATLADAAPGWSSCAARIEPAAEDAFDALGVADQIDALASPRAALSSGGWIDVQATAALTAVDVNTGGDFSPAAGLKANLEAAREVFRQLRLRGLGGQVVVDFAPLPKKDRRRVEDALRGNAARDPVETTLHGWTTMGLFEVQRKRERRPLTETWAF